MPSANLFDCFRKQRHFPGLDGIRCISIVAVMFFHYTFADPRFGELGVDLFFILSGFLITTLLLRERDKTGGISLRNFWMRRVLRIFPIYYGFVFAQIVIFKFVPLDPIMVENFYSNLPAFLSFTNNWFVHLKPEHPVIFYHAWSLAAEEQFYLFWPPMLVLLLRLPIMVAAPVILIAFDLIMTQLTQAQVIDLGQNGNAFLTSLQPAICLGVIAACLLHHRVSFEVMQRILNWYWLTPVTAIAAVATIYLDISDLLVFVLLTIFLMSAAVAQKHALSKPLNFAPIELVGRISYGMYIIHMAAINGVRIVIFPDLAPSATIVVVTGFGLTIAAAALSFYCYEQPILKLRNRFR